MDIEKLENAIYKARKEADSVALDRIVVPFKETDMILYYLEVLKKCRILFNRCRAVGFVCGALCPICELRKECKEMSIKGGTIDVGPDHGQEQS